jgi:hypothetical protein
MTNLSFSLNPSGSYEHFNANGFIFTAIPVQDFYSSIAAMIKAKLEDSKSLKSNIANPEELLTREQAAKEFQISVSTVDNYRREGLITPIRIRRVVRFRRGDLLLLFTGVKVVGKMNDNKEGLNNLSE